MGSKILVGVICGMTLATSAPLLAQGHGGHGGAGIGAGVGGGIGVGGGLGASSGSIHSRGSADVGVSTRATARENSQGPVHASDRALERANASSVLRGSTTASGSLTGLRTGLTVRDTSGARIGTVTRVARSSDGAVRSVLVTSDSGRRRTLRLAPRSLSVSGDVVTTTTLASSLHK